MQVVMQPVMHGGSACIPTWKNAMQAFLVFPRLQDTKVADTARLCVLVTAAMSAGSAEDKFH